MAVTDEQIERIYERLEGIEKNLETRLRALEIWQAYQMGRLTALAVFFSALGALILWGANLFARHLKMLALVIGAVAIMLLSGCASTRHQVPQVSVASTQVHVERTTAYVDDAVTSTVAAKRGVEKVTVATKEAQMAVEKIADAPVKAEVQAKLAAVEQGAKEANSELARVTVSLEAAKAEAASTKTALADTQTKIDSLEAYNVSLTRDRDAAVEHAGALEKSNHTLASRLSRLVLVIAAVAALLVWTISRSLGLKALPVPYCYAWPGIAAAAAGAAVFTYLRYFL
ncbi:MAG: hypothetical protein ACFUZC_04995 [Chthoniobacteraceae bacterium]